jgi:hypothetical protein
MRINIYQEEFGRQDAAYISPAVGDVNYPVGPNGVAIGLIRIVTAPSLPFHGVTRGYVDDRVLAITADFVTQGVLSPTLLPAFGGDAVSIEGGNTFTLLASGVVPGNYTRVVVDAKGRVVLGANVTVDDIPPLSWQDLNDKPDTFVGYGITDALSTEGGTLTQNLVMSSPPTVDQHACTKDYLDTVFVTQPTVGLPTGTLSRILIGTDSTGYLQANGGTLLKLEYPALYMVIGDQYNVTPEGDIMGNGQPWRLQHDFNATASNTLGPWTLGGNLPGAVINAQVIVTNSRVYILGGDLGGARSARVYTAIVNANGSLGAWTTSTPLPVAISFSQVVVAKDRVHLLGGSITGTKTANVYTSVIATNGTLGPWTLGTSLPTATENSHAVIIKNKVFLMSGVSNLGAAVLVHTSEIQPDGTLGTWFPTSTPLPANVMNAQVIATDNWLYIIGGFENWSPSKKVRRAAINPDATIGTWTNQTNLPVALTFSNSVVTQNRVYLLTGEISWNDSSVTYSAPINPDGTIGTWVLGASLPVTVARSHVIVTQGRIHILGGDHSNSGSVQTYSAPFLGGFNDYSAHYNGTLSSFPIDRFSLPNLSLPSSSGFGMYIKT